MYEYRNILEYKIYDVIFVNEFILKNFIVFSYIELWKFFKIWINFFMIIFFIEYYKVIKKI